MSGAVAPDPVVTAPQERGWRWFVLALVAMALVTSASAWPPSIALLGGIVRLLLPVEQFALLVLVSVASCAIVAWWVGGRLAIAGVWIAMSGWILWNLPVASPGYGSFLLGWCLCLGGAFGLICLTTKARPFFGRALAATTLATVMVTAGLASRAATGNTFDGVRHMFGAEYHRRAQESLTQWKQHTESPVWKAFAERLPSAATRADELANALGTIGEAGTIGTVGSLTSQGPLLVLAPALLGLESLLALCLGWATYHRLSRVRIGPPLGALRNLRFNDQLVWGLVVGATILLLPTLVEWRAFGANLICFFGTLYALRGASVVTWWIPDRVAALLPLALIILVPVLGPVRVITLVLAITFGLGLGDTWRDFRADAVSRRTGSLR